MLARGRFVIIGKHVIQIRPAGSDVGQGSWVGCVHHHVTADEASAGFLKDVMNTCKGFPFRSEATALDDTLPLVVQAHFVVRHWLVFLLCQA